MPLDDARRELLTVQDEVKGILRSGDTARLGEARKRLAASTYRYARLLRDQKGERADG